MTLILIGIAWFFTIVIGGAFFMSWLIQYSPLLGGAMLPFVLVLLVVVLIAGRIIIRKVWNAVKRD